MTPQDARDGVTELRDMLSDVMRELSRPKPSFSEASELLFKALGRGSRLWFHMKAEGRNV